MAKKDEMKDIKKNNFGKELKSELKRVTWPSFKQLANNTYAVIAIVLIVAVIVFVLDVIFENLSNFSVDKLKSFVSSNTEGKIYFDGLKNISAENTVKAIDYLISHHFDYRIVPSTGKSMIESGLALEAPEGMYKIE